MSLVEKKYDCIVVGAGIAGLICARALQKSGINVRVLEKARGVGGRMATRRILDGVFDHGAQFVTAREAFFKKIVDQWIAEGNAKEWAHGFPLSDGTRPKDSFARYYGVNGMTTLAKSLAKDSNVSLNVRIQKVYFSKGCWVVQSDTGERFLATALVLTPPVPQSLEILDAGNISLPYAHRHELEKIVYDSCYALLAVLKRKSAVPSPGALRFLSGPVVWLADNTQKGISPDMTALTIHAHSDFSRDKRGEDPRRVGEYLLDSVRKWIGSDILTYELHRWRYGRPVNFYSHTHCYLKDPGPLVLAGDAFADARIEGAARSGLSAAQQIMQTIVDKGVMA